MVVVFELIGPALHALITCASPLIRGFKVKSVDFPFQHKIDDLFLPFERGISARAHGVGIGASHIGIVLDDFVKSPAIDAQAVNDLDVPLLGRLDDFFSPVLPVPDPPRWGYPRASPMS